MNKQSIKLLKEAAYYIKKAEFEKQSGIKGKNIAKAWEGAQRAGKAIGEGVKKGWNWLRGGGKTKMPVDTGMDHTPKPPLKDIYEDGSLYHYMAPADKAFTKSYDRSIDDAYRWAENTAGDYNWLNRERLDGFIADRLDSLRQQYQELPNTSWYKQKNVKPFDSTAEQNYRDLVLRMRRDYLNDGMNDFRQRPDYPNGNEYLSAEKMREYDRDWQNWVDEYSDITKRLGPPTGRYRDNYEQPPYNPYLDMFPELRNPDREVNEAEWWRRRDNGEFEDRK